MLLRTLNAPIVLVLKKNLKSEAQYKTEDPEIGVLIKQAYDVRINDIVLSVELTEQALQSAEQKQNYFLIATAKSQLGLLKMIQGNFKESIKLSEESLTYFEKTHNNKGIAD